MKKVFFAVVAVIALASCNTNESMETPVVTVVDTCASMVDTVAVAPTGDTVVVK